MLRKLLTKIDNKQNFVEFRGEVYEVTLDNIYTIDTKDSQYPIHFYAGDSVAWCNLDDMLDKETAERYAKDRQAKAKAKRVADLKAQMNRIMEEIKELLK